MDLSFDDYKKMEAYFNGELNKAEEQEFLNEVAASKELQEEFEFEKFLRGKSNTTIEKELPQIQKPGNFKIYKYLLAACIAGAVVFISVLIYNNAGNKNGKVAISKKKPAVIDSTIRQQHIDSNHNKQINTEDIYQENYTYYQPTGNEPPELGKVILAYNDHQYNNTLTELEDISITRSASSENTAIKNYSALYKALCFAETNEADKSIKVFQQLISTANNDELKAAAQWYLALELIRQHQTDEAAVLLEIIIPEKNRYSKKAITLLQKIR